MNKALLIDRLRYFLEEPTDGLVLALKGEWGIGKTYLWDEFIKAYQGDKKRYFYVSLFGVHNIGDIKQQIALCYLTNKDNIERDTTLINHDIFQKWGKRIGSLFKNSRYVFAMDILNEIATDTLDGNVICFDDLERISTDFDPVILWGFISDLKYIKKCKIVMIFNHTKFTETLSSQYGSYQEKLLDYELLFTPSPIDSCNIVFKNNILDNKIKELCVSLNIINIRTLQKIRNKCLDLEKILFKNDTNMQDYLIHSLVINTWAYCEDPDMFDFLENYTEYERISFSKSEEKQGETEEKSKKNDPKDKWRSILDSYGYKHTDDLDISIRSFIRNTEINESSVLNMIEKISDNMKHKAMTDEYRQIWDIYHNSFKQDEEYLIDLMENSFLKNISALTVSDLNGAVKACNIFNKEEIAERLINAFKEEHKTEYAIFDIDEDRLVYGIDEEKVIDMCRKQLLENKPKLTIEQVFDKIEKREGITKEIIQSFSKCTEEDLFCVLTVRESTLFHEIVERFFMIANIADEGNDKTANKAKMRKVIDRIGNTNKLNAERIKRYVNY